LVNETGFSASHARLLCASPAHAKRILAQRRRTTEKSFRVVLVLRTIMARCTPELTGRQ
jgi:hypothetical protein